MLFPQHGKQCCSGKIAFWKKTDLAQVVAASMRGFGEKLYE